MLNFFLTNKQTNMPIEQYTYWSVTINNPDENDYLIMRNPNEKYVRSLIWTPEKGEEGTEHIQAWVRLQRNQTLNFMKKLYPRAHLRNCDKDEYNENTHQYAQKNDDTTQGVHEITLNDPLPGSDTLLYRVVYHAFEKIYEVDQKVIQYAELANDVSQSVHSPRFLYVRDKLRFKDMEFDLVERQMILEKSGLEKIFISPSYEKMKQKYWKEILLRLIKEEDARIAETSQIEDWEGTEGSCVQDRDSEAYEDESESSDSSFSEETDRSED